MAKFFDYKFTCDNPTQEVLALLSEFDFRNRIIRCTIEQSIQLAAAIDAAMKGGDWRLEKV